MGRPLQTVIVLKSLRYRTRRLMPGDTLEIKPGLADVWIKKKRAKLRSDLPPPPPELVSKMRPVVAEDAPKPEMSALAVAREEYQAKLGKRPFMGWDVEELYRRISEAE